MDPLDSPSFLRRRWRQLLHWDSWIVVATAYIPLLMTKRGLLADDTKVYLYFDPGHLLATSASMWNSDIGFGTVTHQNIGYLFPMGPYYWLARNLHVSMWIAQRFWMGSLLLFAALGVRRCAQELGLSRWAGWTAAIPYMLSPFILVNLDRTSAILMPWAGLGWMMVFVIRAARRNDWRNPALFALVVALTGGINATSILMVGFAPLFYLLVASWIGEINWRRFIAVVVRVSILSTAVSLWWLAGLWAEGKYGLDILRFTESFATVTTTSTSSEVFRGLGYWYFYGLDGLQPWTLSSADYMKSAFVPAASFLVPAIGFVAALCVRWRYRMFAAVIAFTGVVVAVGSYPLNKPTPIGLVLKWLALHTTVGLAMRSTNRVIPILLLGLVLLTGAAFDALRTIRPRVALAAMMAFFLAAAGAMLPLFDGAAIGTNLTLPNKLPGYVTQAAASLNRGNATSGVLGLPGLDFAYYRFGTFNDAIWPGIVHRPWVSSQVQLAGLPASVNLIRGLDSTLQDGIADPAAIAPIARLFGTSSLLVQMNGQYERYNTPLPTYMWNLLNPVPFGLKLVGTYGPRTSFYAINGPFINEQVLSLPPGYVWPKSLAIYNVADVRSLVRSESPSAPLIVAGNGEGLVALAANGLLNTDRPIFFDGSSSRSQLHSLSTQPNAWLVLTDSNQKRLDSYGSLNSTLGYVEQLHEQPLVTDLKEQSLPMFPHEPARAQSVAVMTGLAAVGASNYGNVIANNAEDQPFEAVDGKLNTAWEVGAFNNAIGQFFQMTALQNQTISQLHFVQPQSLTQNRRISKIAITIDNKATFVRTLGHISVTPAGQTVSIPPTQGRTIRITILDDTGHDHDLATASGVGFAEVDVAGFGPATRGLLLPTTLLAGAGSAAATDHLSIVTNRIRVSPFPPRLDPELSLLRYFDLPYARTFNLSGKANLNPAASDDVVNAILRRGASRATSVVAAESSSILGGSLNYSAWSAFDNDPSTSWQSGFHRTTGEWIQERLNRPTTISNFSVTVVNDGFHDLATTMSISNGKTTEQFPLGLKVASTKGRMGRTQSVAVHIAPLTGTTFRYTITGASPVPILDRISGGINNPSFAISDISIPGVNAGSTATSLDSGCRSDLLSIDGHAVPVRVAGSLSDALNLNQVPFTYCGTHALTLSSGRHVISSALGYVTGFNINNVVLDSPGIASALPAVAATSLPAHWYGRSVVRSTVTPSQAGQWVVLGQSYAAGWHAQLDGKDLGAPTLIDGAAMGWMLPGGITHNESLAFIWQPQQTIFWALLISLASLLLVVFIAVADRPRGRRRVLVPLRSADLPAPQWHVRETTVATAAPFLYAVAIVAALAVSFYALPFTLAAVFLWRRRGSLGRFLAVLASVLLAAGAGITVVDTLLHWKTDISWPAHVNFANSAVWIALALWIIVVAGTSPRGHHSVQTTEGDAGGAVELRANAAEALASPLFELPDPVVGTNVAPARSSLRRFRAAAPDEADGAPTTPVRRRGLNVPEAIEPIENPELDEIRVIPPSGLRRTLFLILGALRNRKNPEAWHAILTMDSINQVIGKAPLFNRFVLDISDTPASYTEGFVERGAHVRTMSFDDTLPGRQTSHDTPPEINSANSQFTARRIPAGTAEFDVVVATNIFSCVSDANALLDELIRVTRPGGSIYVQNVMWNSFLGGRETSPWHLISGNYARRRYVRRHSHEPAHCFGVNYFKVRPRPLMQLLKSRRELAVFIAGPRFLPSKWGWTVKIPLLRSLVLQDMVIVIERR